jgi:hypothetical protein
LKPPRNARNKLRHPFFCRRSLAKDLLFHPSSSAILRTNETGALVWRLCDGQRPVAEIVETLTAVYPEAAADIARDVPGILARFADQGAITWA